MSDSYDRLLRRTAELALDYLNGLPERPVGPPLDHDALVAALSKPLAEKGQDPLAVRSRSGSPTPPPATNAETPTPIRAQRDRIR